MLRFAAAAATSLALLITASGCGGNDPPAPKAEPTSTPTTPAASSSPTPPALPAAAKGHGARSAKAFVRHYIAVLNYATFTGDVSALRSMGGTSCDSCQSIEKGIRSIYRHGGHVEGGAFRVTKLSALPHPGSSGITVDASVHFGAQKIFRRANARPDHFRAGGDTLTFVLSYKHGWIVTESSRAA